MYHTEVDDSRALAKGDEEGLEPLPDEEKAPATFHMGGMMKYDENMTEVATFEPWKGRFLEVSGLFEVRDQLWQAKIRKEIDGKAA